MAFSSRIRCVYARYESTLSRMAWDMEMPFSSANFLSHWICSELSCIWVRIMGADFEGLFYISRRAHRVHRDFFLFRLCRKKTIVLLSFSACPVKCIAYLTGAVSAYSVRDLFFKSFPFPAEPEIKTLSFSAISVCSVRYRLFLLSSFLKVITLYIHHDVIVLKFF